MKKPLLLAALLALAVSTVGCAGLTPTDDQLLTIGERVGFTVQRIPPPPAHIAAEIARRGSK